MYLVRLHIYYKNDTRTLQCQVNYSYICRPTTHKSLQNSPVLITFKEYWLCTFKSTPAILGLQCSGLCPLSHIHLYDMAYSKHIWIDPSWCFINTWQQKQCHPCHNNYPPLFKKWTIWEQSYNCKQYFLPVQVQLTAKKECIHFVDKTLLH